MGDGAELGPRVRPATAEALTLDGGSVLVTGGTRGIGKAIARRFAEQGATRIALGYLRNDTAAEAAQQELRELGAEPLLVRGNVSSERVLQQIRDLGPLDAVVHNAATGVIRPALETEDKHWDWTMNANARALLAVTRAAGRQMPAGSSIVAISSLGSTRVMEEYALVGVSKAAVEALVRYLAVELAPRDIRVNAVSAGLVETGALEHFPNREQMLEWSRSRTPAGRMVDPGDVAAAVAFLCSPDAAMIRGHVLIVDGGFSLVV
jgi:enoyl-[acyl-carrier protein] reductase III